MKKYIVSIAILLFSTTLFAQKTEEQSKILSKHAVGVAAGPTIGCGLAYQYTSSKFSVQATFFPLIRTFELEYIQEDSFLETYCVGLSFYYTLNQGKRTSLFLYQGNHFYYSKRVSQSRYDKKETYREIEAHNNNGLGLGIDFLLVENVSLKLMTGYASYNNFSELGLTGEIALLYHIPSKTK